MEKNCSIEAANWWVQKIQETNSDRISGLADFKIKLAFQIQKLIYERGYLFISTYNRNTSLVLYETALYSNLESGTIIPSGYEMKIFADNVFVYNSAGILVANF